MRPGVAKLGRPFRGDAEGQMTKVSFRVDTETLAALEKLVTRVESSIAHGRRSIMLRRLILAAAAAAEPDES